MNLLHSVVMTHALEPGRGRPRSPGAVLGPVTRGALGSLTEVEQALVYLELEDHRGDLIGDDANHQGVGGGDAGIGLAVGAVFDPPAALQGRRVGSAREELVDDRVSQVVFAVDVEVFRPSELEQHVAHPVLDIQWARRRQRPHCEPQWSGCSNSYAQHNAYLMP
jgi:hypothetical protein